MVSRVALSAKLLIKDIANRIENECDILHGASQCGDVGHAILDARNRNGRHAVANVNEGDKAAIEMYIPVAISCS